MLRGCERLDLQTKKKLKALVIVITASVAMIHYEGNELKISVGR